MTGAAGPRAGVVGVVAPLESGESEQTKRAHQAPQDRRCRCPGRWRCRCPRPTSSWSMTGPARWLRRIGDALTTEPKRRGGQREAQGFTHVCTPAKCRSNVTGNGDRGPVSSSQWGCAMSCAPDLTPRMICTQRWTDETSCSEFLPTGDNISVTHRPVTYKARLKARGHPERAARPSRRSTPVSSARGSDRRAGATLAA